ncbi:Soluble aldose sugar dehydrogenase YliI precursor [Luteitalea pratensis]|uniref:Soluble aldose sugar dehydrogenase YliI n=1 Tax=Luteitalea pratensis TaxID=1855912 RepID=A0A143PUW7_LUTPR|nr:PQQ-dependent sugar dehydrogenase [Luteitalea pratensis]AMY11963.1 Soluble aldose sugar dehydrogenase YliI precursor [Luteitalea pratensis]
MLTRVMKAGLVIVMAVAVARLLAAQPIPSGLTLQLEDVAALPITGELAGENTRGQLARVNYLRDEPGGRRFFVNDLNGPLYILDTQTKTFTTYLDFNGLGGRPGLFPKFTFERNFATGLTSFVFDPDYSKNGIFYTLHMEDPSTPAPAEARAGVVPGLDLSTYQVSPPITVPTDDGKIAREVVLIEWTDRNTGNATFEGTAREVLRVQHPLPQHPLGEMTFNPVARPGDADWRVMYLGVGDSGAGDQKDGNRRLTPQRLDTMSGKILRIVPDLGAHTGTSTVSENGRYRIPNDNPFTRTDGARKEIWAYGLRNPHRLIWDVDPARPAEPRLLAFHIGLVTAEAVIVVHKGANYGWPLREGTRTMSPIGAGPLPDPDTIPVRISDTITRGTITPTYPVIEYAHSRDGNGGDAIANGFVYTGRAVPALTGKLLFGDITTGHFWSADIAEVRAADDGVATTVAPIHAVTTGIRQLTESAYRARGGKGAALPGFGGVAGRGRVDLRFAVDGDGELYVLTKSDGMIRKVVGASASIAPSPAPTAAAPAPAPASTVAPATMTNPVASSPASISAGRTVFQANCAACHGPLAQGAVKAGITISIIEESGGKQPPDLTDAQWDHGSTDGEIFTAIKRGLPPTMMAGYDGRLSDTEIWQIVSYLRSLAPAR